MILNKYIVALLQVLLLFVAAFQAALTGGIEPVEAWQLAGLLIGAIVTYYVPVLATKWAAALKVFGAILGAAIAAIVPLVGGVWGASAVTIVVLAIINALATQFGVDIRLDSAKQALASPEVSTAAAVAVDPQGTAAVPNFG